MPPSKICQVLEGKTYHAKGQKKEIGKNEYCAVARAARLAKHQRGNEASTGKQCSFCSTGRQESPRSLVASNRAAKPDYAVDGRAWLLGNGVQLCLFL